MRKVAKDSSAEGGGLKVGDVILKINGHALDSRGNYNDPEFGLINFYHLVRGGAKVGDTVKIDLIRETKPKTLNVKLKRKNAADYLIDPYMFDRGPKFLILGGMIFQELTRPYLESWGDSWPTRAPFKLVYASSNPKQYEEKAGKNWSF